MTYWKKSLLLPSALLVSAAGFALPAQAQDKTDNAATTPAAATNQAAASSAAKKVQAQLAAVIDMFEKWTGVNELPAVDPARLMAARATVAPIMQRSSIEKMFSNIYGQMFKVAAEMGSTAQRNSALASMGLTSADIATVSDADMQRVMAILNPNMDAQIAHIRDGARPILDAAFNVLQPALAEGLAHGYARRFSAAELAELQQFFATPTGQQFANELLALQSNPELVLFGLRSAPELVTQLEKMLPELEHKFNTMPKSRSISDLSDKDIRQIASILKVDFKTVKAAMEAEKAKEAAAAKAYEAAGQADALPYEAYDRDNWSASHKARVEALKKTADDLQTQISDAEMAAIQDAAQRLDASPKP